jgi:hypothetical protein
MQRVSDERLKDILGQMGGTGHCSDHLVSQIINDLRDARAENESLKECMGQKDEAFKHIIGGWSPDIVEYLQNHGVTTDTEGKVFEDDATIEDAIDALATYALALTPVNVVDPNKVVDLPEGAYLYGKTASGQDVYIVPTPMEDLADAGKEDEASREGIDIRSRTERR